MVIKPKIFKFTNGIKTVEFIGMSHIAPPEFYQAVRDRIANSQASVHFFEGLEKTGIEYPAWVRLTKQDGIFRKSIAAIVGWETQSDLQIHPNNVRADITDAEFLNLMNKELCSAEMVDKIESASNFLANSSVMRFICRPVLRGIFKFIYKKAEKTAEWGLDANEKYAFLDYRSHVLADRIHSCSDTKIIATYGIAHWQSMLKKLQELNPKWRVIFE